MDNILTLKQISSEISKIDNPTIVVIDDTIIAFNMHAEKIWNDINIDLFNLIGESFYSISSSPLLKEEHKTCFYAIDEEIKFKNITNKVYF